MSINLTATNQKLKVITSQAVQTQIVASGRDNVSGAQTPISQDTNIVTATTTDIVAVPGASTQRLVDDVEINVVGNGNQKVTVQKDVGGTAFQLVSVLLGTGSRLHFTNDMGWRTFDALGREGIAVGYSLIKAPILLTTGTTYTPSVNCSAMLIELWGGGGQGGGGSSGAGVAANAGIGAGGWAGALVRKFIIGIPSSITYAPGTAGTTGTATTAGQNGGSTTITINGVLYTAVGGAGGTVGLAVGTGPSVTAASAPIALGTHNGDEAYLGGCGLCGVRANGTLAFSGSGGQADGVGQGGRPISTDAAGDPATGVGSGGSGGCILSTTGRAGGVGVVGGIRFWEFTN